MRLDLAGRTAVVTGAGRGIGLAVTTALLDEGVDVVAGSLSTTPELTALADGGHLAVVEADLTSDAGCRRLVDHAVDRFGGIDVLVNNVGGVRPRTEGFLEVTDEDWTRTIELNLMSTVRATRAALPHLLRRAPASVTTVCSVNAELPDPGVVDYSAAKAALRSLSKSLSKELGPAGIRVNTVSPGPVETPLWLGPGGVAQTIGAARGLDPAAVQQAAVAGTATGRFTRPEEVASLVVYLSSSAAGNLTGTDVLIDGGLVTTL